MEVLILVTVIGIVGAAAGRALQAVVDTPVRNDQDFQVETQLISQLEALRAKPFGDPALTPGSSTTTFAVGSLNYIMTTTVALGDPTQYDPTSGSNANCKVITVTCAGQSVCSMITQ